jgi:hypothetical protein
MKSSINYPQIILHEIEGLPQETLREIVNFVIFVRKRTLFPEKMEDALTIELLHEELSTLNETEFAHLESEFENYQNHYPIDEEVCN